MWRGIPKQAWNTETGVIYCSPGYTWAMIPRPAGDALVTIFRPHFAAPIDAMDTIYVNQAELAELPAYRWRKERTTTDQVEFKGASERNEPMSANLTFSGKWRSPTGKTYDIFYLYNTLQMPVAHTNIRGIHRVFVVDQDKRLQGVISAFDFVLLVAGN